MSYTKKDLEKMFNVADTTVYRTIKAAGLSTTKRNYSEEEVVILEKARALFRAGLKGKEVRAYFMAKEISFPEGE